MDDLKKHETSTEQDRMHERADVLVAFATALWPDILPWQRDATATTRSGQCNFLFVAEQFGRWAECIACNARQYKSDPRPPCRWNADITSSDATS